jgi:uncharacterized membrane protein
MDLAVLLFWSAAVLSAVGVVTGWFTTRTQLSLACTAFSATALGCSMLLESLELESVIWSSVMFGFAAIITIVAAVKERNDHAREEVE